MQSDTLTNGSVDRSVGFLLLGLGVGAFLLLTILGMGTVQRSAEKAATPELDNKPKQVLDFSE
ncbi:hypothetical protein [Planctomicrobium sp. SH664]|uniref:hypothetical protein n=1 Tax=Planctomicrobium sp. SH664 TaxID=3448125 RepID=UPI003F5C639F